MTNLKRMMLVGVVLAAGAGCPKDQVCTPGEQVACACVGGAQGAQRCSDDGTVLGECACPSGSSSSSGGASSQAGTSQVATSQAGSSSSSGGVSGSNASSMSTGSSSLTASTTSAGSSTSAATSQAGTSTSVGSSGPGSSSASAGSSADNSSSAVNSSGVASSVMGASSSGVESSSSLASSSTSMAPVYGGVVSLLEAAVLNPGNSGTFYGQGMRADIAFSQAGAFPAVLEEQPGSPLGCKAWSLTPTEAAARAVGEDMGTVGVTLSGATSPTFPPCVYAVPTGYQCRYTGTQSPGGVIGAGPQAGTATLTDPDVTYQAGNTMGSHVLIQGAAIAANNGLFPILALAGANTIVFANPAMAAETLPGTAFHVNVAGAGPIPAAPDPGFLSDGNTVDVTLTSNGGPLASFTASSGAGTVGDDFSLEASALNLLNSLPSDGSSFTLSCGVGSCGAGSATGTLLTITTTDASTAGQSPFVLPPPVTRQVVVRCLMIGTSSVTVPAAYSDLLRTAGATRVRGEYARVTLIGGGPPSVSVMAGHSVVGHTNF